MNILEQWTAAAGVGLGLDPGPLSTAEAKTVLDVARDRLPAGVAVGRGLSLPEAADRIRALAAGWPESTP
jgi:hypothetical protein